MKKRRPPWGLMGLVGLGGLVMMGASQEGDEDSGSGGGTGDDDPPGSDDDDRPGWPDLPPPPTPDPEPDDDRPVVGGPLWGDWPQKPQPRPTKPGTTGGGKPPVSTPDDDPYDDPPVAPPPEEDDPEDDPPLERDPPWSELVDPYPRGARFYLVQYKDRFGGTNSRHSIAYRFLLSEAYLCAVELGGMPHEDAMAWALGVGRQDKIRQKVIDLIQCSGWNDAMYGADPVNVSHASAHGRSILLRPVHGPTAVALEDRTVPFRNITLAGNPADGTHRKYEVLWLAAIDREVLWESGGTIITTTDMRWSDGTSMENPPPWVMALGIEDLSGALSGDFGCPGSDGELEVE